MPLAGYVMDIEGQVLVYQTEKYQLTNERVSRKFASTGRLSQLFSLAIQSRFFLCHYLDTVWILGSGPSAQDEEIPT